MKVNKLVKVYAAQRLAMHSMLVKAMAQHIPPNRTGIEGVVMWTSSGEGLKHSPRLKVSNIKNKFDERDNFTIRLDGVVKGKVKLKKELDRCVQFVLLNRGAIIEFWANPLMDPADFMRKLKPVRD